MNFSSIESQYVVSSDYWYQINKNILTVYYKVTTESEIGICDDIAVVNIDQKIRRLLQMKNYLL